MANFRVTNDVPTVADFWWKQPLVDEHGSLLTDPDGNILVEQMVVRSLDSTQVDQVAKWIALHGDALTFSDEDLAELRQQIASLTSTVNSLKNSESGSGSSSSSGSANSVNLAIKSYSNNNNIALPANQYNVFVITLSDAATTITLNNSGLSTKSLAEVRLYLKQGTGANTVAWDSKIKWLNGIQPSLSYVKGKTDIVQLSSTDGGASWLGSMVASWN